MRTTLKRVVMWLFHKYNNVGEPLEVRDKVTGKDVANILDTIVFYCSYVVMVIATFGYILHILI